MDILRAKEIIECLADGVNPLTGQVSPPGGFLQSGGGYPGVPCGPFCSSGENAEAPAGKCREAMDKCGRFSPGSHV